MVYGLYKLFTCHPQKSSEERESPLEKGKKKSEQEPAPASLTITQPRGRRDGQSVGTKRKSEE